MSEIQPATYSADVDVDALLGGAWTVERHLSPLALFDPNRTSICAQYQLTLVDDPGNEARAHILAARRHLEAAAGTEGLAGDGARWVRKLCGDLDTLSRRWD